jgi:2-polyprenyl-6-methoxyphenol hydroxylase-like FAD-dependent oxidoreductase
MRQTDIAIVGSGLAGSTAAAMLGLYGISAIVIDPHRVYPPDFRCEKMGGPQLATIRKTGLYDAVRNASTLDHGVWTARFGRIVDKRPSDQHGLLYHDLVNAMRREIPPSIDMIEAKVTAIATSLDRQTLTLSTGEQVSARLIVLANGLNVSLRYCLGIQREVTSPTHSITIGFNVVPADRSHFEFPALTYFSENSAARMAYLTLFPIGDTMRANLMVYREMDDPWLSRMRHTPKAALREIMPGLETLCGDFSVEGPVKIRPADLVITKGHRQAGVVLVGDAFATSCPAAGTGTSKVFMDVERLCNVYIPAWLATPGMSTKKISAFYDDPQKRACDANSSIFAYELKSVSIDNDLGSHLRRWARFMARLSIGTLRQLREALTTAIPQS